MEFSSKFLKMHGKNRLSTEGSVEWDMLKRRTLQRGHG